MTQIGRGDKARDRWLSADFHTSLSTDSAVKCRPEVEKLSNGGRFRFLTMNPLCPIELLAFNERRQDILSDHPKV